MDLQSSEHPGVVVRTDSDMTLAEREVGQFEERLLEVVQRDAHEAVGRAAFQSQRVPGSVGPGHAGKFDGTDAAGIGMVDDEDVVRAFVG